MNDQKSLSEKIIWAIKNNRVLAYIIVFGIIVIAIGSFTDATKKITNFIKRESPEDARNKLGQMEISFDPASFYRCVDDNDINCVKLFLSAGMSPDTKDSSTENSVLTCAVDKDHHDIIEMLLDAGAGVNITKGRGLGPLSSAARPDRKDILLHLLKHKPDVKSLNAAFVKAAYFGYREIMDLLVKKGVDLTMVEDGDTILAWALENAITYDSDSVKEENIIETIKFLLTLGADVNIRYNKKNGKITPLLLAIEKRHDCVVKTLLNNGADPEVRWECDRCMYHTMTPLMLAVKTNQKNVAEILLDAGASINTKLVSINGDDIAGGSSALMMSVCNSEISEMLINRNADLKIINDKGESLLSVAAHCNDTNVSKILISKGLDINHKNNIGNTPLFYAADNHKEENVRLLLDNGTDVNIRNKKGEIALMFAVDDLYCDSPVPVIALLDKGSDVNARDNDDITALMIAAERGCINYVKILLERGADATLKDSMGRTVMEFAEKSDLTEEGKNDLLRILTTKGASKKIK